MKTRFKNVKDFIEFTYPRPRLGSNSIIVRKSTPDVENCMYLRETVNALVDCWLWKEFANLIIYKNRNEDEAKKTPKLAFSLTPSHISCKFNTYEWFLFLSHTMYLYFLRVVHQSSTRSRNYRVEKNFKAHFSLVINASINARGALIYDEKKEREANTWENYEIRNQTVA